MDKASVPDPSPQDTVLIEVFLQPLIVAYKDGEKLENEFQIVAFDQHIPLFVKLPLLNFSKGF